MKKVLLTGISGYIGEHCALELLKAGYAVRGSLRNMSKEAGIRNTIEREFGNSENLEFCELNLLEDKGWDTAMQGVDYVMHVASPFFTKEPKDVNKIVRPAVEGTLRALKAAKHAGVKRVVLTSSMVAMMGDADKSISLDQNSWTNVQAKRVSAYLKSKTLAEQSAWDFIQGDKEEGSMDLVVINPGAVYGPSLSGNLSGESMAMFREMILGKLPMLPKGGINISDVRDVAKIHVQALEKESASNQRFIVASDEPHAFLDLAQILKNNGYDKVSTKLAPSLFLRFMANFLPDIKGMLPFVGNTYNGDNTPAKTTFDWTPRPLESTVLDTAESVEKVLAKN